MATLKEKIAALAESLKGDWFQSDFAGFEGKLIEVLYNMVDFIPEAQIQSDWNQDDNSKKDFIKNKPTVLSASQVLEQLTISSTVTSFTDAEGLTEEEACTALGITSEQLAGLFAGDYLKVSYGTDGASILTVSFVSPHLIVLGAAGTAEVAVAKINDTYSIQATYV